MADQEAKKGWSPHEERSGILHGMCCIEDLLEMGRDFDIEWFKDREKIDSDYKFQAAERIAEKVEGPEELEELINSYGVKEPPLFSRFDGGHYRAEFQLGRVYVSRGKLYREFIDIEDDI